MRRARILLGIFLVSVSVVHLIELGHSVLHRFTNPLHHHATRHLTPFKSHSLADHHFPAMKFAYEMDEPASSPDFMAIAFGFFQTFATPSFAVDTLLTTSRFGVAAQYTSLSIAPPTPPPLG